MANIQPLRDFGCAEPIGLELLHLGLINRRLPTPVNDLPHWPWRYPQASARAAGWFRTRRKRPAYQPQCPCRSLKQFVLFVVIKLHAALAAAGRRSCTELAERNRPRLPENDRREIAKHIFDALCAKIPEKYVALVQPRGDPTPPIEA